MLLGLVNTALRRGELIALDWKDVSFDDAQPSVLVRSGKGGKPRRQPLAPSLARELERVRAERRPEPDDPVFCGLARPPGTVSDAGTRALAELRGDCSAS